MKTTYSIHKQYVKKEMAMRELEQKRRGFTKEIEEKVSDLNKILKFYKDKTELDWADIGDLGRITKDLSELVYPYNLLLKTIQL